MLNSLTPEACSFIPGRCRTHHAECIYRAAWTCEGPYTYMYMYESVRHEFMLASPCFGFYAGTLCCTVYLFNAQPDSSLLATGYQPDFGYEQFPAVGPV